MRATVRRWGWCVALLAGGCAAAGHGCERDDWEALMQQHAASLARGEGTDACRSVRDGAEPAECAAYLAWVRGKATFLPGATVRVVRAERQGSEGTAVTLDVQAQGPRGAGSATFVLGCTTSDCDRAGFSPPWEIVSASTRGGSYP